MSTAYALNEIASPHLWRQPRLLIPSPKTKDLSDPDNFRPISLPSALTKSLDRHVREHLTQFIEDRSLFHHFLAFVSGSQSLWHWLAVVSHPQLTSAVCLDFRQVLDLVSHTILLQKLPLHLQNSPTVSLLKSCIHDITKRVFRNGNCSTKRRVKCGIPQGSVVGHLYSVFSLMTDPYKYQSCVWSFCRW